MDPRVTAARRSTDKLTTVAAAGEAIARWRAAGEPVVLVSESFDLLDVATLRRLEAARSESRHVIAAVWSDARVRAVLGAGRPLLGAADRALLVAALRPVDLAVVLDDPFPDWLREVPGVEVRLFEPAARTGSDPPAGAGGETVADESEPIDPVSRLRARLTRS
jgi:bifunctional ADP-heptose synthase (sugar kinase/adenylyltransferase)